MPPPFWNGDGHALVLDAVDHRVGDQIAHLAFFRAADFAAALDRRGGLRNLLRLQLLDRRAELLDAGEHAGVRRDRLVEEDRIALGFLDDAVVVEGDGELAEIFRIGRRLRHRNLVALRIVDHRRIRAFGLGIRVRQQRVRMTADHHVDAGDFCDQLLVPGITDMGERDDLVDALPFQLLDLGGDRRDVVLYCDVRAGRGDFGRIGRHRADNADFLAADVEHQRRLDAVADLGRSARLDVGTEHRELDHVEERRQRVLAVVELVIADGHRVELHLVQELGLGRALVGRVEQRALEIVAAVQEQHVLALELLSLRRDSGDEPCGAADAFAFRLLLGRAGRFIGIVRFDAAVPVVDVQDGQIVVGKGSSGRQAKNRGRQRGYGGDLSHANISRSLMPDTRLEKLSALR